MSIASFPAMSILVVLALVPSLKLVVGPFGARVVSFVFMETACFTGQFVIEALLSRLNFLFTSSTTLVMFSQPLSPLLVTPAFHVLECDFVSLPSPFLSSTDQIDSSFDERYSHE